jgi:hypothetical protein
MLVLLTADERTFAKRMGPKSQASGIIMPQEDPRRLMSLQAAQAGITAGLKRIAPHMQIAELNVANLSVEALGQCALEFIRMLRMTTYQTPQTSPAVRSGAVAGRPEGRSLRDFAE